MAIINGEITISGMAIIMAKKALLSKIYNPDGANTRADFFLQEIVQTKADQELLDLCYAYMLEISAVKRNSNNGQWHWESPEFTYSIISRDYEIIGEICGCWLGRDCFYTDQDHETWR